MKYVTYISFWYSPKNKLEGAVNDYLHTQNRLMLQPDQLEPFKKMIEGKVTELNTQFSRCKAVTCGWWADSGNIINQTKPQFKDWHIDLSGHGICTLNIYVVADDFKLPAAPGQAAPNQLNLLDEIEVSKKTFYMSFDSTTADVLETYAPQLPAVVKEQISITVDKIIEQRVDSGRVNKFSDRVNSVRKEDVQNVYVPRHIKEAIETIADGMYAEGKAHLMRLTLDDINLLKKKWDRDLINELRDLLNQNLVDIYDNTPINIPVFLDIIGEKAYTTEKLLRLLSQGKVSAPRIEAMLEAIKKEYKVWNEEDELEAQES